MQSASRGGKPCSCIDAGAAAHSTHTAGLRVPVAAFKGLLATRAVDHSGTRQLMPFGPQQQRTSPLPLRIAPQGVKLQNTFSEKCRCACMLQPRLGARSRVRVPAPVRPWRMRRTHVPDAYFLDARTAQIAPLVQQALGGPHSIQRRRRACWALLSHLLVVIPLCCRTRQKPWPCARAGLDCPSHPAMNAGAAASAGLACRQPPLPEPLAHACAHQHALPRGAHGSRAPRDTRGHAWKRTRASSPALSCGGWDTAATLLAALSIAARSCRRQHQLLH